MRGRIRLRRCRGLLLRCDHRIATFQRHAVATAAALARGPLTLGLGGLQCGGGDRRGHRDRGGLAAWRAWCARLAIGGARTRTRACARATAGTAAAAYATAARAATATTLLFGGTLFARLVFPFVAGLARGSHTVWVPGRMRVTVTA